MEAGPGGTGGPGAHGTCGATVRARLVKMALSGQAVGNRILARLANSTTPMATLMRRRRKVSNWAVRQSDRRRAVFAETAVLATVEAAV